MPKVSDLATHSELRNGSIWTGEIIYLNARTPMSQAKSKQVESNRVESNGVESNRTHDWVNVEGRNQLV